MKCEGLGFQVSNLNNVPSETGCSLQCDSSDSLCDQMFAKVNLKASKNYGLKHKLDT